MPRTRTDRPRWLPLALAAAAVAATGADAPPADDSARFFEAKVRPVLAEHCYKCHGPEKQKSNLRLDTRASALAGGDQGPAVVPGKPEESLLVTAVGHEDDALKMPPSKKLAGEQVGDLVRWVKMGAPWPGSEGAAGEAPVSAIRKPGYQITDKDRAHWAFRPVARPAVPQVGGAANPVDAFVLANLAAKGLTPNPPAPKVELARRAYYDLTGLPPTPAEVNAFVNDPAPDAFDRLVDRLLDSPHYGEKWGRHWLDLVRFAETNSYERDNPKPNAWRYRDYVIKSLNDDKPYDRFVREQLAGDEAYPGDNDALVATGFYRLGIWDDEPTDREQARFDGLDDVVATTGQVFLGLTVDCARCHDHKIDPIPQKDYYRMVSFFRNVNHYRNGGPTDEAPLFRSPTDRAAYDAKLADLARRRDEAQAKVNATEADFLAAYDPGQAGGVRRRDLDDLRYKFYRDTFETLPDFDAIKPEESGELPAGRFDLAQRTRDEAFGFVFEGVLVVPERGEYTFELDSDDGSRLAVGGRTVLEYDGIHETGHPKSAKVSLEVGRVPVRLDYFQMKDGLGLSVAWSGPGFKLRTLSASEKGTEAERGPKPADLAQLIRAKGAAVLGADRLKAYLDRRRELRRLSQENPAVDSALVVTEAGPKPPETFVLLRGNPHANGDKVDPAFLSVLGGEPAEVAAPASGAKTCGRRTALADWIVSPGNPLTARVMANRVWQHHFGRGIVRSPNNFGTQGDKPTHPDLLDWLASELVANGWRLKPLHRLVMTSDAYRRSSRPDPTSLEKDPANDAFWRFDMRRLTAEEVRDSVLAVCGNLSPAMYGPGVYPPIPAEVMAGQSQPGKGWGKSTPEEASRRSVYVHVKRSLLTPILEGFDFAETDRSSPVRFASTQPTQALAMLNGTFLNDQAGLLAARLSREAGSDPPAQVALALRLVTGRTPTADDVARGVALVDALRRDGLPDADARRAFALLALNLNEFLFLD